MTVTIIGPTEATERQRELDAAGKWRIFNGVCFVHDYNTKEEAKKNAIKFDGTAIGKAHYNGKGIEYREVERINYDSNY
ncbi:hypothetical protein BKP56_09130 [Marinilactibacillus sp. 15R]|uniref:hypothetical protein n=1 Tax=Marinilactibacillus sp. 15R TaxID=1911586 RepID=UPI00090B0140|nr:hypothetical protein [Marinilactibacillus sp. 15R]API89406.1 hypothetical protein BKP56_09130 [Marinilactibacillus sp. 15R]